MDLVFVLHNVAIVIIAIGSHRTKAWTGTSNISDHILTRINFLRFKRFVNKV
jgi:molybdopterin synthase catalytic subunit